MELTPATLRLHLLEVAPIRPVFVWGPPGVGKSSLVEQFAKAVGMPCVTLMGSQLASEDILGVPQIENGKSRFCPPAMIARDDPYVLFLDELNGASQEVQKAFYSLILDKRIGDFRLHRDSIIIGAGNRAQDMAIVKKMSSALINRLSHVQLKVSHRDWLAWAESEFIHGYVIDYIRTRPDHLWSKPPAQEEPFSTPRSWHAVSDILRANGKDLTEDKLAAYAKGNLTPAHAVGFMAFCRQAFRAHDLNAIIKGERSWPEKPDERDILMFMVETFRARLIKELPEDERKVGGETKQLAMRAKDMLTSLARISNEFAQIVVLPDEQGGKLPDWFATEIFRDLPRLASRANA